MSITLTYNDDVSRVQIEVAGLTADRVRIERSHNDTFWQIVRGGRAVVPVSGVVALDDYEFDADVPNYYRAVDTADGTVLESDEITPVLGTVWLKSIRHPFLNRPVTVVDYTDPVLASRGMLAEVAGRSVPSATSDKRTGDTFEVELMTETVVAQRDMALALKSGNYFVVHTPADCQVPGGHVWVRTVEPARRTRSGRSPRRYWRLVCTVVAPPGPDVRAATMTYGGLMNLYGSYANTRDSGLTYRQLLDLMGSPDDLVVI